MNKLISASPNKTCQLDPVPTWPVKEMRELLAPFIILLFNRSLVTGCFPSEFKHAIVRPLLEKSGLHANDLKNYKPVSNLPLLSKLLERVVQRRLQAFLDNNELKCQVSSQRTVSTTALRRLSLKYTMIFSWRLTVDLFLPCACST